MSVLDCSDVRDAAPEFALGVLDGDARADVVLHLDRCPACRTVVAELAETADAIALLAPEAEPPPGFEQRVLEAVAGAERRRRWRTAKLVAVVAAAAAIVSVVGVRVIDETRGPSTSVAAPALASVPMVGADGQRVGRLDVVDDGTVASLSLTVGYALADGEYRVVLVDGDGARQGLGTVRVVSGSGSWSGSARLGSTAAKLALVDPTGRERCWAELPAS